MDLKFLWNRIRILILDPEKAWQIIGTETRTAGFIRNHFFLPLVVLAAVSAFVGSLLFTNPGTSGIYSVLAGIKYLILYAGVIYATSFIFNKITTILNIRNDPGTSFMIIVFSAAPLMLCQIVSRLFESFIFINILALYGLYLFWLGTERLLNPPEKMKTPLMLSVALVFTGLLIIIDSLLTRLVDWIYFAFFA
ncbi:MAG TPA: hypothetical protein PKL65_05200 [Bacteroidales bacterium]|nr:hypothetical protein [Bacteroidales bacterium]HNR41608.1 hypothetical protein [Bacteroidales bacterium]